MCACCGWLSCGTAFHRSPQEAAEDKRSCEQLIVDCKLERRGQAFAYEWLAKRGLHVPERCGSLHW